LLNDLDLDQANHANYSGAFETAKNADRYT
jgi:hypothetical protein